MRILGLLLFISILLSCSKEDDSPEPNNLPEIDYFKHQALSPTVRINSYDSIKLFSCGPTPFPLNNQRAFTYDINEDFQADFRILIGHRRYRGSGCPFFHYDIYFEGLSSTSLIATDNNYSIKFDEGDTIQSVVWKNTSPIVKTHYDPVLNHTFYGKKYIGISVKKGDKTHFGYFKVEFSQTDLFIMEYAVNFENSNVVIAGQKE